MPNVIFDAPVHIHNSGTRSTNRPETAAVGNNVYLTWFDTNNDNLDQILFSRSLDKGKTFSPPTTISADLQSSHSPQIIAVDEYVYIAWSDGSFWGIGWVYFSFSEDYGSTFSAPMRLSHARGSLPQIALSESSVYVAWSEVVNDEPVTLLAISRDNGRRFKEPARLAGGGLGALAAIGNRIYIALGRYIGEVLDPFRQADWFLSSSQDSGETFSGPLPVSKSPTLNSIDPKLAVAGNNVYVVWMEQKLGRDPYPNIYFAVSADGGATFGNPVNISNTPAPRAAGEPCLAAGGQNVYIVWLDTRENRPDYPGLVQPNLFFSGSHDGGRTFSAPVNLTRRLPTQDTHSCRTAVSGDRFYLAWTSTVFSKGDVFFTSSQDNGHSFGPIINLSNDGRTGAPGSLVIQAQGRAEQFVPDELKVKFKPGMPRSIVDQVNGQMGATIIETSLGDPDLYLVKLPSNTNLDDTIRRYMQDSNVIRATKNLIVVPYESGIRDVYTGWAVYAAGGEGLTLRGATDIFFVRGKEGPSTASIQGRVLVPSGSNAGILVELLNAGLQTTTDESGTYRFFNLPSGNYTVLVRAPGLPIERRTNVVFQGQPVTVSGIYLTPAPKGIKGAVLIGDLWISTDDAIVDNQIRNCGPLGWIGGVVVADPSKELGFFFHPSTIFTADVTQVGWQTTIDQIRANPELFAGRIWAIRRLCSRYISLKPDPDQQAVSIAHVADGTASDQTWKAKFVLQNTSVLPASSNIQFFAPDGSPLNVTINDVTGSVFNFTLSGRGLLKLETSGLGKFKTGWANIHSNQTIHAFERLGLYDQAQNLLSEVIVSPSPHLLGSVQSDFAFSVDTTANQNTGIAFVGSGVGSVGIKLLDMSGKEVAAKSVSSPPNVTGYWQHAMFVTDLFRDYAGITKFEGSVIISGATTSMALNARDFNFVSIPVIAVGPEVGPSGGNEVSR